MRRVALLFGLVALLGWMASTAIWAVADGTGGASSPFFESRQHKIARLQADLHAARCREGYQARFAEALASASTAYAGAIDRFLAEKIDQAHLADRRRATQGALATAVANLRPCDGGGK